MKRATLYFALGAALALAVGCSQIASAPVTVLVCPDVTELPFDAGRSIDCTPNLELCTMAGDPPRVCLQGVWVPVEL